MTETFDASDMKIEVKLLEMQGTEQIKHLLWRNLEEHRSGATCSQDVRLVF